MDEKINRISLGVLSYFW